MADTLAAKTCTPCKGGDSAAHAAAGREFPRDDAHRIERKFKFHNFGEALRFVQQVGQLAEAEGHHPDICFGWGHAAVSLQTKKIKGLHENDFIMAAKIDRVAERAAA